MMISSPVDDLSSRNRSSKMCGRYVRFKSSKGLLGAPSDVFGNDGVLAAVVWILLKNYFRGEVVSKLESLGR